MWGCVDDYVGGCDDDTTTVNRPVLIYGRREAIDDAENQGSTNPIDNWGTRIGTYLSVPFCDPEQSVVVLHLEVLLIGCGAPLCPRGWRRAPPTMAHEIDGEAPCLRIMHNSSHIRANKLHCPRCLSEDKDTRTYIRPWLLWM